MKTTTRWAWILIGLLAGQAALAQRPEYRPPRFEIAPMGGYRIGGEFDVEDNDGGNARSVDFEEAGSWGLGLGIYRDPNGFYEFLYSRQTTELDDPDPALGSVDITTEYYQLGGTLLFDPEPWLRPYLSLTIGITRFDADGFGSEIKPSGSLGVGLRFPVGERLSFLTGLRGYGTLVDSNTDLFCSSVNGEAVCLVQGSGDVVYQGEVVAGFVLRF